MLKTIATIIQNYRINKFFWTGDITFLFLPGLVGRWSIELMLPCCIKNMFKIQSTQGFTALFNVILSASNCQLLNAFQVFKYILRLWERRKSNSNVYRHVIFPICVYNVPTMIISLRRKHYNKHANIVPFTCTICDTSNPNVFSNYTCQGICIHYI